ncbi:hypothetical protein ACYSNO_01450 [Enterococcus sp. LJL98]
MNDSSMAPGTTHFQENYDTLKKDYQQEVLNWIKDAEAELADLYLRKSLLEADFETLLAEYKAYILSKKAISTIAKTNLLEYFSYDLLRPFHEIGMEQTEHYNTWETRHFFVAYQLDETDRLVFHFKLKVIDDRFLVDYLPLITLDIEKMTATVEEEQVHTLISLWYSDKFLSRSQLSLFNQDLNGLFIHFQSLGFTVLPSLLDNTQPLAFHLTSHFPMTDAILDRIFITAMESEDYDFDQLTDGTYRVQLTQGQNIVIETLEQTTKLFVDSNQRRRSILDFATSYPFLVPLFVQEKYHNE